jgi:hypothetical protein
LAFALVAQACWGDGAAAHPDPNLAVFEAMVKNALAAVNQANLTGNYTVLRDLGSDEFRRRNSAADLAGTFAGHRQKHYDLSPTLCAAPRFSRPPAVTAAGRLELVGLFETRPEAVHFAVAYQKSAAGWALDAVSVGMAPVEAEER